MKLIKKMSKMIEDEIEGAECYVKMALKLKDERPELAKMFYNLSLDEMGHMDKLHKAVVEVIEQYRKEEGEPPVAMMAVYEYLHNKHIDDAAKVKTMQEMFRG